MLREIVLGQYAAGDSPVHRLDPRTKLLLTLAFTTALFAVHRWPGYGLAALGLAAAWVLARLSVGFLVRSLRPVLVLVALTVALHVCLTPAEGPAIWAWGPVRITAAGLDEGLRYGVRVGLLVLVSSLLTLTTSPIQLADAIDRLARPLRRFGFPGHELAMMMTIALRFVPTLIEEADRIVKAQLARGADLRAGGALGRIQLVAPILVPLFVGVFRRADELALAMECRGYRGGEGRTRYRELRLAPRDAVAAAATLGLLGAVVAAGRGWWP